MIDKKLPEEFRASEILYKEISESKNSIRRENIRLIKLSCDQMEKDKVPISAAEVTRRCGENGPAYSTISNTGSKLGEYIRLRITEQIALKGSNKLSNANIADGISDPLLQAQVRDKESLARMLITENSALRSLLKSIRPGVDIDGIIQENKNSWPESKITDSIKIQSISHELQAILLKLMDHLVGERMYRELRGRLTINNKVVLDSQEFQAYREASGLTAEEWKSRYGS